MACFTVSTDELRQDQILEMFVFMCAKIVIFLKFKTKNYFF